MAFTKRVLFLLFSYTIACASPVSGLQLKATDPKPEIPQLTLHEVGLVESMAFVNDLTKAIENKAPEVHVTIDSPGGSVATMFEIIDLMRQGQAQGMEVQCTVNGMAASAAAIILEAGCSTRKMTLNSQLMFHEPATAARGKEGDFRRTADELADVNRRVATLIAWRMGMTADEYVAWIKDRNRWCDWSEALRIGAIDAVTLNTKA